MIILRKRFIPNEIIDISGDEVVFHDEKRLITKWLPIKPREDIAYGESCIYFEDGWKISKFFDHEGNLKFWYCDIVQTEYFPEENKLVVTDLLLDVVVHEDDSFEILDENELEKALQEGLITEEMVIEAKEKTSRLVSIIKEGRFHEWKF